MKNECNIVRDILPLYVEELVSEDTKALVEEHLSECSGCRQAAARVRTPAGFAGNMEAAPLKRLKKKLMIKRVQTIVFTTALVLAIAVSAFAVLTAPKYLPYSEELISVTKNTDGAVVLTFDSSVTSYSWESRIDGDTGIEVYRVSAWTTIWDKAFSDRGVQNMVIPPSDGRIAVYYYSSSENEDRLVYGVNSHPNGGTLTLPRLVLGMYFNAAARLAAVLALALVVFRKKEKVRLWLERALFLPVSYVLGHLLTKGFVMKSYDSGREFLIILLAALLIYCALLLGIGLYRMKKSVR